MMNLPRKAVLSCSVAVGALAIATGAWAQQRAFDIPAQSATKAVPEFARQAGVQIISSGADLRGLQSAPVKGEFDVKLALAQLLDGTGLTWRGEGDTFIIERADAPQGGSAADGADGTVQALIVTAQKREENIQDVPIAMSAFSQEALERSQVAGGPDLITQVPNMTFTKTNFTSYSIQLRGIGTQAISATTDAAVAVAFNNTPFIRNRFFEQEFYDLQRVEVLRGPQGTLYGRNATAGVVNLISQKPKFAYEAKLSGDLSNFSSSRLEGMVNVPLVEDKVALRIAAAWTKREGYSTNELTGNPIDGRDLWSTRLSLRFTPTDKIDANLIWEHFEEDDDRLRSGKQLCHKDTVTEIRAVMPDGTVRTFQTDANSLLPGYVGQPFTGVQGTFSQGCKPASLYSLDSFETPNGLALPYVAPMRSLWVPISGGVGSTDYFFEPYKNATQSTDLRVIESTVDPHYQAESDVVELQWTADLSDNLSLTSETGYNSDTIFSTQDYNRFATASGLFQGITFITRPSVFQDGPNGRVYCDPQIGCADRLVAVDLSTARSRQFSQEVRISSDYDGPFNFSLGANFLRYDTEDKYYVFINTIGAFAALSPWATFSGFNFGPYVPGVTDNAECLKFAGPPDVTKVQAVNGCVYMDPNPIGSLNDKGHNYFLSKNPYKLISYAVFGESYYKITDNLKLTAGFRWTVDKKEAPRIPSWIMAANSVGYPVAETIDQEWREPTGRLTLDWKPDLSFTDETLLYASLARGYKAGGMNPPATGVICYICGEQTEFADALTAATHPKTFAPEFVNAFELGAKNTLLDGHLTLNTAAFYYDYQGYQISQIVNRAAVNQNFDANVWGLEIEADWRALENLRLGFKGGYEKTKVADGMSAVDVMDRTAGHEGWVVVRPFPTFPSNCVLPAWLFVGETSLVDVGSRGVGGLGACELAYVMNVDPITELPYTPNPTVSGSIYNNQLPLHPGYIGWDPATAPNHGAGFSKDIGGNELPNAPHFTATVTADYTLPLPHDWLMTVHTDLYYQSEAWARIFNTEGYDKLKAYSNINLAAIFTNEDAGWKVMAYVKNVLDRTNVTGSFLNSDDTGLTTNIFMTEPRLYGLRVTKEWSGGPWWTGANANGSGPLPLTVEIGGQVQRHEVDNSPIASPSLTGLADAIDINDVQRRDLDWGDGRSLRLTWQPVGSSWSVSVGARYGRANATDRENRHYDSPRFCRFRAGTYPFNTYCNPASPYYSPIYSGSVTTWADAENYNREEHTIADFEVGRDVGMGSIISKSKVRAGLRYADIDSSSAINALVKDDWVFAEGWIFNTTTAMFHRVDIDVEREFKGAGPSLGWDGTARIWQAGDLGELGVDWSLTGAVLFGKQAAEFDGQDWAQFYSGRYFLGLQPSGDPTVTAAPADRSKSVSAPVLDLSLGLAYEVGRVKVGGGYRWERYFNVLDVGYDEHKDGDRTIDGPYFKIAVGFGG